MSRIPSSPPPPAPTKTAKSETAAPAAPTAGAAPAARADGFSTNVARNEATAEVAAPRPTECPHRTAAEKQEQVKKIPCPALSAMFTSDMLPVGADGTVKVADLDKALTDLGISRAVRALLTHGGDNVDDIKGQFNIFKLNGSSLDHTGSSGIRQNGVHPERFELLTKFSSDGQRLTPSDLAKAARHFEKESPGFRGAITQLAEMAILLETFGQRDEHDRPYFMIDDLKKLWVDGELPPSWKQPPLPGSVRLDEILARVAKMKASQIF